MDIVNIVGEKNLLITDWLRSWEKFGRTNFMNQCKKKSVDEVIHFLHELAIKIMFGDGKLDYFNSVLLELSKTPDVDTEFECKLADLLWILDTTASESQDGEVKKRSFRLFAYCQAVVGESLLKERLSEDTLENLNIIQSKQTFMTRYVKTKTRLFYKQQKFNLLREENEGYAKLITELAQFSGDAESTIDHVKSLIGYFDLDPNRVLDIMLDVCEKRISCQPDFLELIRLYNPNPSDLAHTVGHKFHFLQHNKEEDSNELYDMTALFIHHKLIKLPVIYSHLAPSDDSIKEYQLKDLTEAKARKSTAQSSDPERNDNKENIEKTVSEQHILHYENNQKIGLCTALLNIGDWENAKILLDKFPEHYASAYAPLSDSMCRLMHYMANFVYNKLPQLPKCVQTHRKKWQGDYAIDQAENLTDLVKRAFPIATYLGASMSSDVILMVKLCRLGQSHMNQRSRQGVETIDFIYQGFFNLLDEVLLPSLTLVESNCCLAEEIWEFIRRMPFDHRYRLYGQWKYHSCLSQPRLIRQKNECLTRIKYIMKRLTQENVKPMGRQIGKLCHGNPGVVFDNILAAVQLYNNLIGPVVDAFKYLGNLSYDVLTYSIIEAFASPKKVKLGDLQLSPWLTDLSNFTGLICKKYSFDLSGLLQYVLNQLKDSKSYDLVILSDMLHQMSGIEISEETTDDQLEASTGGEILRQEGSYFCQVRNTRRNSARLKDALMTQRLTLPLLFMMARQRDSIVFLEDQDRHLKLVCKLYDQCQDTLVQFGTFLSLQLSTDEFVKQCPTIDVLMGQYHVPADAAFFVLRSVYSHKISNLYDENKRKELSTEDRLTTSKTCYLEACQAVIKEVVERVRPLYPERVWNEITPTFFVTFWSLQTSDLEVPHGAYQRQIDQIKIQVAHFDAENDSTSSKKKEKDRLLSVMDRLMDEEKRREEHVNRVHSRLEVDKNDWFLVKTNSRTETITQLLELCVFPRVCFTAMDALFAAKFIHMLHTLKTPNFSTLICFDRIFHDISLPVTSCTENEAHRYGRFLCAILEMIMSWHGNRDKYETECGHYPGFVTVFRKGTDSNTKVDPLEFENYRHVAHKWHYRITRAMVSSLESNNYVQIRNTLIVLTKILPHYPRLEPFGKAVERRVDKLIQEEKDKRKDLHVLALSYAGQMRAKKSQWIPEVEFHIKSSCGKNKVNGANSSGPNGDSRRSDQGGHRSRESESKTKINSSREVKSSATPIKDERGLKYDDGKHERSSSVHSKGDNSDNGIKSSSGAKFAEPHGSSRELGRRSADDRPSTATEEKRRKLDTVPLSVSSNSGTCPSKTGRGSDNATHLRKGDNLVSVKTEPLLDVRGNHNSKTSRPAENSSAHDRQNDNLVSIKTETVDCRGNQELKNDELEERKPTKKRATPSDESKRSPIPVAKMRREESSGQVRNSKGSPSERTPKTRPHREHRNSNLTSVRPAEPVKVTRHSKK